MSAVLRGQVVQAAVGQDEPKLFLVVSNNGRNQSKMDSVLVVRLTTTSKWNHLPSVIEIPPAEGVVGSVMCDNIMELYDDEIMGVRTTLSVRTMALVDDGLRVALALGGTR